MPNHVTNKFIITNISQEQYQDMYNFIFPDPNNADFDFNLFVPQPEDLYQGVLGYEEREKYPLNWYDWNIKNWGTKWNAYSTSDFVYDSDKREASISFDTAWDIPIPIINEFSERFMLPFTYKYIDEGWNFWGIIVVDKINDEMVETNHRESIKEDLKSLSLELRGHWSEEDDEQLCNI